MFDSLTRIGASAAGAYEIEKSLRFNDNDSAYLQRTNASNGNQKTWTFSFWVKRSGLHLSARIFCPQVGGDGSNESQIKFHDDDTLWVYDSGGASGYMIVKTATKYRDNASWYHFVIAVDTTQGTASNRLKIYVNGVQETNLSSTTYGNQNQDMGWNKAGWARLGAYGHSLAGFWDGYLAEIHMIDGTQLTPASFGETDTITKQWIPKKYAGGNYGTNGFYLNFSDNSGTTATTLGKDSSGQGNNWTPHNFSVAAGTSNDSLEDTPTNNFPTFDRINGIKYNANYLPVLQEGNLLMRGGDIFLATTFLLPKSGKWYFECSKYGNGAGQSVSITAATTRLTDLDGTIGASGSVAYITNGEINNRGRGNPGETTAWTNDASALIGCAVDMDNGAVYFAHNNTWQNSGDPTSGSSKTGAFATDLLTYGGGDHYPACSGFNGSDSYGMYINFGQRDFSYTPPTGYKKLCTNNLPVPTIKDPSKFFNTGLYTGTGSERSITGLGFQPDMVSLKMRSTANQDFCVFDSVRGATRVLRWNNQETSDPTTQRLKSLDSDGFTLGTENITNQSSKNFVYWAWKESASAGFDMVKYTGNGSSPRTVSHSLGVVPEMYWIKNMETNGTIWVVGNKTLDADENVFLSSTDDDENVINYWASTRPTSSVFTVNNNDAVNKSGEEHIAYLFASVPGVCKVGTYTGNGDNNGAFLHLGFRPSFFLVKNTNDNEHWALYDDQRGYNGNIIYTFPSWYNAGIEVSDVELDIVSNGIKFRQSHNRTNFDENGAAYIYLAMARNPFKYANAR